MASKSISRFVFVCLFSSMSCAGFCLCRAKPQICLCSGKSKFSLHRSVEVFCTREKAAFRWGLFRSKPFPRRLHLRVCPRLLPLLPRITLTTLTIKTQKKRKSLCIWWKKRQAIILCLSLVLGILNLFLTLGFKRRNLFPNGMSKQCVLFCFVFLIWRWSMDGILFRLGSPSIQLSCTSHD